MISISQIRKKNNLILVLGNHQDIIQSILDFDYLSGKKQGSVAAIVTGRRAVAKYFFGRSEILIPTLASPKDFQPSSTAKKANLWFLNLTSGRRALSSTLAVPSDFSGGVIFAENTPELHALTLIKEADRTASLIIGPASVGLLVPSVLKLGPIGGITPTQINESELTKKGSIAVLSASGGMTNELINIAIGAGHHISFALSFGGDRFPVLSPRDAFLLAEADPNTSSVLYYGELGGEDEYELNKLREEGKFTKYVVAHIAGTVASLFKEAPQFGHAKAKASKDAESAVSKRKTLKSAGFQVSNSFTEFINLVAVLE